MDNNIEIVTKENEDLKKMLDYNFRSIIDLSNRWQKTMKIIVGILAATIIVGIISFSYLCNLYFKYAYDSESMEKQNTTTNINRNINENDNKN